jgi:hypothetical protein
MSDIPNETTIVLRNTVDRIVPVVNKHSTELSAIHERVAQLEAKVAQQQTIIAQSQQDAAVARALAMGTGATGSG